MVNFSVKIRVMYPKRYRNKEGIKGALGRYTAMEHGRKERQGKLHNHTLYRSFPTSLNWQKILLLRIRLGIPLEKTTLHLFQTLFITRALRRGNAILCSWLYWILTPSRSSGWSGVISGLAFPELVLEKSHAWRTQKCTRKWLRSVLGDVACQSELTWSPKVKEECLL